ncbi:MAG: beta-propeller domain-containing protein [Oscillospiraceae bacterium]|nr:beta-propeller domain-containing protein [Oscillospiraceae bacterium]
MKTTTNKKPLALALLAATALVLICALVAAASSVATTAKISERGFLAFYVENPTYRMDGKEQALDPGNKKVSPYLKNGLAYVPLRAITEALGGSVVWDAKKNAASFLTPEGDTFEIAAGSDVASLSSKNGKKSEIKLAAKAELFEERLYAPAESVAEIFGIESIYSRGLILMGSKQNLPDGEQTEALLELFTGITTVQSKENLYELLNYDPNNVNYDYGYGMVYEEESLPLPAPATGAVEKAEAAPQVEESSPDYSETNVQVAGVDEADIIKTDGRYIYYAHKGIIEIVMANPDGSFEYMSAFSLPTEEYFEFSEIFVDGDKIIAIGTYYKTKFDSTHRYSQIAYTKAVVIDTNDKKAPEAERFVEVKGNYVTSRKIGVSVYFVTNEYFWLYGGDFDIMPRYRDTAVSNKYCELGYEALRCFPTIAETNLTTLVGFDIEKPKKEAFIESYIGCGSQIYMSGSALYIAASDHFKKETQVRKFAASGGSLVYVNSGTVPGSILNQFSMDEYNNYFRLVTTYYDQNIRKEKNGLYILDDAMEIVGKIEDIAPGERIYSARFMGERAFMVTFRTVDPLFAIELSDPYNPKLLGALKIPGYSNYLHPYDENHLIGFGKDTVVNSYGNAYYTGMKISLFDITDMTNPIEMFVESIGDRGTNSELLNNHKALLFSKEKNLLAFPVSVYESKQKATDGQMPEYGSFKFAGAYVYDISLESGFSLRGQLTHMNYKSYIKRLLTIGDRLYAASDGMLTSHDLSTLELVGELEFSPLYPAGLFLR